MNQEAARMGEKPTTDQLRGMIGPQLDFPISGLHFEDGKPRIHVWCSDALAVIEYLDAHDQLLARCAELEKALSWYANPLNYWHGKPMTPYVDGKLPEGQSREDNGLIARAALASQGEGR